MSPLRFDGLLVCLLLVSLISGYDVNSSTKSDRFKNHNFTEITRKHGYKSEEHNVVTEDGYLLKVFRITDGVKCVGGRHRTPVLVMHGLLLSGDCWLDAGPAAGLAYLLADACFDTWVGNVRGTHYSRRHLRLDPDRDKRFWQFSVDEMGLYDIPAMIDYVLKETGVERLNYIGYSQGAGTFFIMCSEKPEYSDKIKLMIALAPASRQFHTKSALFRALPILIMHQRDLLQAFGIWELFARKLPAYEFLSNICQYEEATRFCQWILTLVDSPHPGSISRKTLRVFYRNALAGTSAQNMARYGQSMSRLTFSKFDFGIRKNIKLYGSKVPPDHNLTAVNVPVVVMYGKNDGLVDVRDIEWLASKLPNVRELVAVEDQSWNHLDMAFSQNTPVMTFPKIHQYLGQYD